MITFNIIGAGALGQTLGYLLTKQGLVSIQGILNTSQNSGQRAATFIGQGEPCSAIQDLPPARVILISVPDRHIQGIADLLAQHADLESGTVIMHCSGALSSAHLRSLQKKGCWVASLHPAMSFKTPELAVQKFIQIPCALEGDEAACDLLHPLFTGIGAQIYRIDTEKKALYHVAAVFGTNYLIPLLQQSYECFVSAGLPHGQAQLVLNALLGSIADNINQSSEPKVALTGPIRRGDVQTIAEHLSVLTEPEIRQFYGFLAQKTLNLTELDATTKQDIQRIISA